MKDILDQIIANKRFELDLQKQTIPLGALKETAREHREFRSMRASLASSPSGIIAEFKRRSPSKGWIKQDGKANEIPPAYERAGASALSILTDEKFFGGTLGDIRTARPLVQLPILRKDFIIDEYQLLQARIAGADAILLIASCLTLKESSELAARSHALGLEVLLEIHTENELDYVTEHVDMVGINNRNLGTFVTDIQNSFILGAQLRNRVAGLSKQPLLVSESGINSPAVVNELRKAGFRGFLIGEAFMKTDAPGPRLQEFIQGIDA